MWISPSLPSPSLSGNTLVRKHELRRPFLGKSFIFPLCVLPSYVIKNFVFFIFNITYFSGFEGVPLTPSLGPRFLLCLSFSPSAFVSFLFSSRLLHPPFFDSPLLSLAYVLICLSCKFFFLFSFPKFYL